MHAYVPDLNPVNPEQAAGKYNPAPLAPRPEQSRCLHSQAQRPARPSSLAPFDWCQAAYENTRCEKFLELAHHCTILEASDERFRTMTLIVPRHRIGILRTIDGLRRVSWALCFRLAEETGDVAFDSRRLQMSSLIHDIERELEAA